MNGTDRKERLYYLDVLRIVAMYGVIFIHSAGMSLFSTLDPGDGHYFIYMFITELAQGAVPLFLMISGALLLGKNESYQTIFRDRISRMLLALIAFSFMWFVYLNLTGEQHTIGEFFIRLITDEWCVQYWYIYLYIGYLLILPLLQTLAQNLEKKTFGIFLVIAFICIEILPFLTELGMPSVNGNLVPATVTCMVFFYPLLGYYLDKVLDLKDNKGLQMLVMGAFTVIMIASSMWLTYRRGIYSGLNEAATCHCTPLINAWIFLGIKKLTEKRNVSPKTKKILIHVSQSVFGIYLLHGLVDIRIRQHIDIVGILQGLHFNHMIAILAYCWVVFGVTGIISYVLRKMPLLKKIL